MDIATVVVVAIRDVGKAVGGSGLVGSIGAAAAAAAAAAARQVAGSGQKGAPGFAYASGSDGRARVYDGSQPGSPEVAQFPNGSRFVYRGVTTDARGEVTGYFVDSPGVTGWTPAGSVSTTPLPPIPPGHPSHLVDSGLGTTHSTPSMCICAHG